MVFGYDNPNQQLKCLGFEMETGGLFTEMLIHYADFREAYEQGRLRYAELAPPCLKTKVTMNYMTFHLLYEHKKLLAQRFEIIGECYQMDQPFMVLY